MNHRFYQPYIPEVPVTPDIPAGPLPLSSVIIPRQGNPTQQTPYSYPPQINVLDPGSPEFHRTYSMGNYYLTVYAKRADNHHYCVQYTKKYSDGRTIWLTESLTLPQINNLLDRLSN